VDDWSQVLAELVERRGGALVRYAQLLCGDDAEAQDLVQDALVRTFATPSGRRADVERAESYVRRAVLHRYLDGYRRRRRWDALRHLVGHSERVDHVGLETRADVADALRVLGPRQRTTVVLRYFADLPLAAVAEEMGVAVGTVKRHLHDAHARLAPLLDDGPATDRAPEGETV
jgi:RNA polymerase sigma factor (sigma-70 family)